MTDENKMAIATVSPTTAMKTAGPSDLELTATQSDDMAHCQSVMIEWAAQKIFACEADELELKTAYEHAVNHKWKSCVLQRHWKKAEGRTEFYRKFKAALEAGYVIVPNFPVTVFLIRTDHKRPFRMLTNGDWSYDLRQKSNVLPAGEGDYKNPLPDVFRRRISASTDKNPQATTVQQWAEKWKDIDFPINMAKPQLMEATTRAMALNIFDEFGVLPSPYKKEDPMIVGRILRKDGHAISFMIVWYLNTRDL